MIKFGTGGWRAEIGDDFTKNNIRAIAHAIAYLNIQSGNKPIIIGRDNRFLSLESSIWVATYLNSCGIDTYSYEDSVPTPLVMWHTKKYDYDYGIMITASHNPYYYNGIKVFVKGGLDAPKDVTNAIENLINEDENPFIPTPNKIGANKLMQNYADDYIKNLYEMVNISEIKSNCPKIAFNGMNGSASNLFIDILNQFGIKHFDYATDRDPEFSSNVYNTPEPTEKNITTFKSLVEKTARNDSDCIGIVFDGDGDRLMVLDENQEIVDMNTLLCIYYWYLHEYRHENGAVIKNCVTTMRLNAMAKYYNEECIEVPVGFKWITDGMNTHNALIGGESSGGFTYRGHVYGKDSILATVMLLETLAVTGMKLCEITELLDKKFGKVFAVSEKINKFPLKMSICDLPADVGATKSTIDGVKFVYSHGWGAVRESGTEPIIRIMAEANDPELANGILAQMKVNLYNNRGSR